MEDKQEEKISSFNLPRPASDPYIAGQYQRFELGDSPSLADNEPHAEEMMRVGMVLEGMGLVLGRRIDAKEVIEDPDVIGGIVRVGLNQPEQAFGLLLLKIYADETQTEL